MFNFIFVNVWVWTCVALVTHLHSNVIRTRLLPAGRWFFCSVYVGQCDTCVVCVSSGAQL